MQIMWVRIHRRVCPNNNNHNNWRLHVEKAASGSCSATVDIDDDDGDDDDDDDDDDSAVACWLPTGSIQCLQIDCLRVKGECAAVEQGPTALQINTGYGRTYDECVLATECVCLFCALRGRCGAGNWKLKYLEPKNTLIYNNVQNKYTTRHLAILVPKKKQ